MALGEIEATDADPPNKENVMNYLYLVLGTFLVPSASVLALAAYCCLYRAALLHYRGRLGPGNGLRSASS
jgi:hypothetical protein